MLLPHQAISEKISIIKYCLIIAIACISARLFYLQLYKNDIFYFLAQKNFLRSEKINSYRGNILDCHGNFLATNKPVHALYWQGSGKKSWNHEDNACIKTLEAILNISILDKPLIQSIMYAEKTGRRILLHADTSYEQLGKISEQLPNNPHIIISSYTKRFYPYKNLASHIVGYMGACNVDKEGKMGLEKICESMLKGEHGELLKTINSLGAKLSEFYIKEPLSGKNLITTLDLNLQKLAEESFDQSYAGCLIVLDPQDGAIKALASYPNFDPSIFSQPISPEEWTALHEKKPFINRALHACYPPASIFKIVSLSAALETGIIDPNSTIYCKGFTRFYGRNYHCANKLGHGLLTIEEAFAQSCNILFFDIAKRISINTLAEYAHRFGLGNKTNSIFSEKSGLVPSTEWKWKTMREPWWPGETLSSVIGQSYLLVTPLQIARMIGSIFEDYLVTPRILQEEPVVKTPLVLKPQTRSFIQQCMHTTVIKGSAIRLSKIKNLEIYGKTGTAQVSSLELREAKKEYLENGWLVAYFRDKDKKTNPLVLVILAEHAGSSTVATSIAKKYLMGYQAYRESNKDTNKA